jgi:hypothetical protein
MTHVTGTSGGLFASTMGPTEAELEDSRKRVRVAAFALGAVWVVILLILDVAGSVLGQGVGQSIAQLWPMPGRYLTLAGLALALVLALATDRLRSRPRILRDLGLVVMVATCGLLAVLETWAPVRAPGRLSWVCLIILLYPSIAADSPGRTLAASLAAAATVPAAVIYAALRGVPPGGLRVLAARSAVPGRGLGVVPAQVIRQLGRE